MPRHSSARFRCAGPALRLFLLSVFLTPSAFGQSMWKPFEPEWRMTARTAPSTVAGTDADTAWLSAAWESGADDLNLSDLNRRFPLLQLAQELADAIEKAPRAPAALQGNPGGAADVCLLASLHIHPVRNRADRNAGNDRPLPPAKRNGGLPGEKVSGPAAPV